MPDSSATIEIYGRFAPVYDVVYGALLQPGRRRAMTRLSPGRGESILEIGVGSGLSAGAYPPWCRVVAIDVSATMMERARARLARQAVRHVVLCRMDAAHLAFPDASFDAIYAPYVINVVSDPVRVAREMLRVCRPGGRLVLLNHFDRHDRPQGAVDRFVGRVAARMSGVNWDLDLRTFLHDTGLTPWSLEPVNLLSVSSVMVCYKA